MAPVKSFVFFVLLPLSMGQVFQIIDNLNRVTDFALKHHQEINFDGLLGFVIAETQILQSLTLEHRHRNDLKVILENFEKVRQKVTPILPKTPSKMVTLKKYLLDPKNWFHEVQFTHVLPNFGIYKNWTVDDIISDKRASFRGVPSDFCLMEILQKNCYIGPFCREMMLAPRIDKGYLLSHRIFYLQILRIKQCSYDKKVFDDYTKKFCSLMLRETRTNDYLDFPAYDIALEQMVLCGIEGYAEFLNKNWRNQILEWQTPFGCYKNRKDLDTKRTSNIIAFGCSDHTTGLGAAALALNLRYILQE